MPLAQLPARFRVRVGLTVVEGAPHPHYQAVPPGELLALVGSAGLLEISARDGSAASVLGAERGERVHIEPE